MVGTQEYKTERSRISQRLIVAAVFVVPCFVALVLQTFVVLKGSNDLRFTQLENSTWMVAELESDYKNLLLTSGDIIAEDEFGPAQLSRFQTSFDVYFNRFYLMQSYLHDFGAGLVEKRAINEQLARIGRNLQAATPAVDALEVGDVGQLRDIQSALREVAPDIRGVVVDALTEINDKSRSDRLAREDLIGEFVMLSFLVLVMLAGRVVLLGRSFRDTIRRSEQFFQMGEMLQAASEASIDAIVITDQNGRVVRFNRAAERIFGYTREEAVGGYISQLFMRRYGPDVRRESSELLRRVTDRGLIRNLARRRDGEIIPVEISVISEIDAEGVPIYIGFARDVTQMVAEQRRLRQDRRRARREAQDKTRFVASVSHELRTPLQSIVGTLDLLKREIASDETQEILNTASEAAQTALDKIEFVSEFNEYDMQKLHREPQFFDPVKTINDAISSFLPSARVRGLDLRLSNDLRLPLTLRGLPVAFRQAIWHLLSNAINYSEEGLVEIRLMLTETGRLRVEIEDQGVGLSEEEQDEIFEEFVSLGSPLASAHGIGLGLSIVRRAVDAMQGIAGLASIVGEGSVFWFEIPVEIDQSMLSPPDARRPRELRVLVVDDHPINRSLIARMVRLLGHHAEEAAGGREAIRLARDTRYDVILMDLNMPEVDGLDATQEIRASGASNDSAVIIVTANMLPGDKERIMAASIGHLLLKPVSLEMLAEILSEAVPGARMSGHIGSDPSEGETDIKAELIEVMGEKRAATLLAEFRNECRELLDFAQAAGRENRSELSFLAHRCAGGAAVLGAKELRTVLCRLEEAAVNGSQASIDAAIAESEVLLATLPETL